ncbi:MAG TPA: hypothetical protein VK436_16180 [Methanocella sp.]|nr:hypothetical protein [Methanocella sp.]
MVSRVAGATIYLAFPPTEIGKQMGLFRLVFSASNAPLSNSIGYILVSASLCVLAGTVTAVRNLQSKSAEPVEKAVTA